MTFYKSQLRMGILKLISILPPSGKYFFIISLPRSCHKMSINLFCFVADNLHPRKRISLSFSSDCLKSHSDHITQHCRLLLSRYQESF